MIEAIPILAGGLLGSGHCIGMCGGFALTLGSQATSKWYNLFRQSVYAAGRVSVYTFAGAVVGFAGWKLGSGGLAIAGAQATLSISAGLFLVAEGLFATGWVRRPFASIGACPGASGFAALLKAPSWSGVFVAGMVNGLLPCGLVYAYLALAASSGNVLAGAGIMALFGCGTFPALLLTGMTGTLLSHLWRQRIILIAAGGMVLTGVMSLARGVLVLPWFTDGPTCPGCAGMLW